LRYKTSLQD